MQWDLDTMGTANEGGGRVKGNFHSLHIWGRNLKVYEVYKFIHFIIGAWPKMSVFISSFYSFFFFLKYSRSGLIELSVIMELFYCIVQYGSY